MFCAGPLGLGCCPIGEETAFLQLTSEVARRGPNATQAVVGSAAHSWLQAHRLETWLGHGHRSLWWLSGPLIALIVVVVLFNLWYAFAVYTERDRSEARQTRVRLLPPKPEEQSPLASSRIPPTNARLLAQRSPPAIRSCPPTPVESGPIGGLRVPPGQKLLLAVPSLLDEPIEQFKKSEHQVTDETGKKLLHVDIMRPPEDTSGDETPVTLEYVTICSVEAREELAMCALGPAQQGGDWECHLYSGDDELLGYIIEERTLFGGKAQFTLISHHRGDPLLWAQGDVKGRRLEVFGRGGAVTAVVGPGNFGFGQQGEYYSVSFLQDADVGLVVLVLMGVDRLLSHRGAAALRT
uniref:Uncharacterized protein n=1 Tax=Pyrodinium bahamense TaxID=73915 RepID=A0A7R9ZUH0_9DINO|mmetsp:Transcript_10110/g.28267  ORF Transcript_10110/g.28267 Transcript_10110/m.28267 type:complete len:352 (+) Transcript_10110:59-1114(+)